MVDLPQLQPLKLDTVVHIPLLCNDNRRVVQTSENCTGPAVAVLLNRWSMSQLCYLEKMQSMIKSKAELECMEPPLGAYWDLVLKRNRAKRLQLFKNAAKYFLGISFVNKKGEKTQRLILDARVVNWAFVSPPSANLCFSEAISPYWHSALQNIELSLGLGGIQDCVLDDEFASYFGVDTL